jgi:dTDP-4-dehydrorhamnose 3,5-epimerase
LIEGIKLKKLKVIPDERGRLQEILRADDEQFIKFGQVYFTTAYPGVVKGWHYHKIQTDNITVIRGMMKLVLYDARVNSPTHGELMELFLGEHNPLLVYIPPMILHGMKCIGTEEAMALNIPTEPYNYVQPDEYRLPWDDSSIPYNWECKNG